MFPAFIDSINSTSSYAEALGERQNDLLNTFTPGYTETRSKLSPSSFGVVLGNIENSSAVGSSVFIKGEKVTKLAIDKDYPQTFFLVRDAVGKKDFLTRLGDFKYSRTQKLPGTYIGQPFEERTYLTTQEGYAVLGYPIGKGPVIQQRRFKDPLNPAEPVLFGQSPIRGEEKKIGEGEPLQLGPLVPIDLTRGSNGLVLDRYEELEFKRDGILYGSYKGLFVPLYKLGLVSVPNPEGLARIENTAYRLETESSGLRQNPPPGVKINPENLEKSSINTRLASFEYKKIRNNLNLALSLQRSNAQLFQQFQQLLQG